MSTMSKSPSSRARKLFKLVLLVLTLGMLASGCILIGPSTDPPDNGGEIVEDTCPASHPNDCGSFCCPSGTTCNASGVTGARCAVPDTDLGDIGDSCDDDDDCASDLECLYDEEDDEKICTDE